MSVDLKSVGGAAATTKINTIVNFKEARSGNVILCAGPIYIYTMRASPTELRIINVGNGNSRELFKQHSGVPTVAKITSVGVRQSMIASGSDSELIVWSYQAQAISTFFTWSGVKVSALEWVKSQDSHPSLIVMYSKNGGEQKLGVINTKKVMERYAKAGLDAKAVEITADDVNEPTLAVADCNLLAAGVLDGFKAIAAASSSKPVVNVVFSDNTTAKVSLPDSEGVKAIYVNDEFFLVVAGSKGSVVVYNLRNKGAEPKAVLTAKLPQGPTTSAALGNVVSFVSENTAYTLQITLDGAKLKSVTITEGIQTYTLVEDNGAFRGVYDTEKFLNTAVVFDKNSKPVAMDVSNPKAVAANAPTYANAPAAKASVSLKNNTLANVAAPASISTAQSQAVNEIDVALDDLRAHINATNDTVATYGNKTHKMDLELVIQHALEAQVTELLKLRLPAVSGAPGSSADLDESFVNSFRANLANNISAGITAAIDGVAESITAKIRETGKKNTKKAGTEALKKRLDEFVGEANSAFANALSDRMRHGDANFKNSVGQLNRANDENIRVLQQQVDDLNAQLRAVAASGIIEEVKRLRKEVAQLKVRASQAQAVPVSPDTLIQTAIATIDAGNEVGGFEYAVATNQASVVSAVLLGVKEQAFESSTLSTDLWSSVLTLGAIGAQTKEEATAVLNAAEVVKDDETILTVNAGKARVALKAFSAKWKSAFSGEAPLRNQLKSLDIELGTK